MMCDLVEMAYEHLQMQDDRKNAPDFAKAVARWVEGDRMQFRVDPSRSSYGSTFPWHDMKHPHYMPNFQYRALPCDD